jgi:hypothetical protein
MESAAYCVGHELKASGSAESALEAVLAEPVETLYERGKARVDASVMEARTLLELAQEGMLRTGNRAYNDTLRHGLPLFFDGYDSEFGAHESPGSIDYPVRAPALCGVEYMLEYLKRLDIENRFCRAAHFSDALLRGYHSGWRDMLENLCALALGCAVGAVLCGKRAAEPLEFGDAARLAAQLNAMPPIRMERAAGMAFERTLCALGMADAPSRSHLAVVFRGWLPVMRAALRSGYPETAFIAPKRAAAHAARFTDGVKMDDEAFRALTEALRGCSDISEKITMIRERVRSMADLTDLLGAECLYGGEFEALFSALDGETLRLLKARCAPESLHASAAETEWQRRLARVMQRGYDGM